MRTQKRGAIVEMSCDKPKNPKEKKPYKKKPNPDQFQNQCTPRENIRIRREENDISDIDEADATFYPDVGTEEYGYVDPQDETTVAEVESQGCSWERHEDMDSVLSSLTAENCMTEDRRKKLIMNEESYVRDQIANARNLLWEYSLGTMQKKSIQLSLWSRLPI